MAVLKFLEDILQIRSAAVFHNICPQLLSVLGTVARNDEDLGPITLQLWPEVHLAHRKARKVFYLFIYSKILSTYFNWRLIT